jgi:hypothetical protein
MGQIRLLRRRRARQSPSRGPHSLILHLPPPRPRRSFHSPESPHRCLRPRGRNAFCTQRVGLVRLVPTFLPLPNNIAQRRLYTYALVRVQSHHARVPRVHQLAQETNRVLTLHTGLVHQLPDAPAHVDAPSHHLPDAVGLWRATNAGSRGGRG